MQEGFAAGTDSAYGDGLVGLYRGIVVAVRHPYLLDVRWYRDDRIFKKVYVSSNPIGIERHTIQPPSPEILNPNGSTMLVGDEVLLQFIDTAIDNPIVMGYAPPPGAKVDQYPQDPDDYSIVHNTRDASGAFSGIYDSTVDGKGNKTVNIGGVEGNLTINVSAVNVEDQDNVGNIIINTTGNITVKAEKSVTVDAPEVKIGTAAALALNELSPCPLTGGVHKALQTATKV